MFWAQSEGFRSPYCLSQSGMPAPDPRLLGLDDGRAELDLGPPPVEALPALEQRLAQLFGIARERVLVTMGASGAMHLAAMRFFRGARVVTEVPSYEPFRALPRFFGAELQLAERRLETGFALEPERFRSALAGARPGHVFVANPHNPSGAFSAPETVRELARLAAEHEGLLVSNEVYMECAAAGQRFHAFELAPNAISIGGLTKAYGLGALRIGWMLLGEGLVHERQSLIDLAFLVGLDPPTPSLRAARLALDHLQPLLQPLRQFERHSRPQLVRWLRKSSHVENAPGDSETVGLTFFPRVRGAQDTRVLARFLAAEHQVDVVPGEFFGAPGHIRVGYGVPEATLREGISRLEEGLGEFSRVT